MRGDVLGRAYKFSREELAGILSAMGYDPGNDSAEELAARINQRVSSPTVGLKNLKILRKTTGYPEAWRFNAARSILKAKNDYWASK